MIIRDLSKVKKQLFFCNGDACKNFGSGDTTKSIRAEIIAQGLHETVHTAKTLCNGRCHDGSVVIVVPDGTYYKRVSANDAPEFVEKVLKQDGIWSEKLLYKWLENEVYGEEPIA